MAVPTQYLLDTNIVLHFTRANSPFGIEVERQFQLSTNRFRPAVCEVTIAELWAFSMSSKWGEKRKELLKRTINDLVVIPIGDSRIHQRWAELRSFARSTGAAIQHDHNDMWIAATAYIAGLTLLSADVAAFKSLRGTEWVNVQIVDPNTGIILP